MKNVIYFLGFFIFISCQKSDTEILKETITTLEGLKTIEYDVKVDFYPKKEGSESYKAKCFYDFTSKDTLIGAKFHYRDSKGDQVFDGSKMFSISKSNKTVLFENKPVMYQLLGSFIYGAHSPLELKAVIPLLLKDSAVVKHPKVDTVLQGKEAYGFKFELLNMWVAENRLKPVNKPKDYIYNYELFFDKQTNLPLFVKSSNSTNNQELTVAFSDFRTTASRPDSTWSYDRFSKDYVIVSEREYYGSQIQKIKTLVGKTATDFTLPTIVGDSISLSKLEDKLVLLEFWFKNCGPCVDAIPEIANIQDTYKEKRLGVYGIEFNKATKEELIQYVAKHNIKIPTMYEGKEVAKNYNVMGAPVMVLMNKQKEILYANFGFDKEKLVQKIDENL